MMPWPPDIVVAMIGVVVIASALFGACVGAAFVTSRLDRDREDQCNYCRIMPGDEERRED